MQSHPQLPTLSCVPWRISVVRLVMRVTPLTLLTTGALMAVAPSEICAQGLRGRIGQAAGVAGRVTGHGETVQGIGSARRMKQARDLTRHPAPFAGTYVFTMTLGTDTAVSVVRLEQYARTFFLTDTTFADLGAVDENATRPGWVIQGAAVPGSDPSALPRALAGKHDPANTGVAFAWGVPITDAVGVTAYRGAFVVIYGPDIGDEPTRRITAALRAEGLLNETGNGGGKGGPPPSRVSTFEPIRADTAQPHEGATTYSYVQQTRLADGRVLTTRAVRVSEVAYPKR